MSKLARVLYIEDEPDIQEIASMALKMVGGLSVKICSSGEEALTEVEAFAPDIILLDVMMPNMDGISTLAELRKIPALSSTPIVFMTAKIQPNEIENYITLGALGAIAKPFDPMTLTDQVRAFWNQRHN